MIRISIGTLFLTLTNIAVAEIYNCESKYAATIDVDYYEASRFTGFRLVIDTDRGFLSYLDTQRPDPDNKYSPQFGGTCIFFEEKFIKCTLAERIGDSIHQSDVLLDTKWNTYVHTSMWLQHTSSGTVETGECNKIL